MSMLQHSLENGHYKFGSDWKCQNKYIQVLIIKLAKGVEGFYKFPMYKYSKILNWLTG